MRTPLGVGMNGGLSLRSPAAMLRCLKTITPEMVNEYRIIHGLTTVAYNPPRVRSSWFHDFLSHKIVEYFSLSLTGHLFHGGHILLSRVGDEFLLATTDRSANPV